jgi:L-lysine exporter family protein LysE/ArgO
MELFVLGFLLSLSLCLDLGVVNVAMVRTGLQHGAKAAFLLGLGSSFGDLIYALTSLVAISFVLQNLMVRWCLWLGGTGVLLALTYRMLKESFNPAKVSYASGDVSPPENHSGGGDFARGLGLALASPSAILWFATVGGSVIASSANGTKVLVPFFVGFFGCGVSWSLAIAIITGQGRKVMGPNFIRALSFGSALLFLYFAIKVFVEGYRTLLR